MKKVRGSKTNKRIITRVPDEMSTVKHDGHVLRSGKKVVDRSQIGKTSACGAKAEKKPNQFTGHTFKNEKERFRLDGHKLIYHLDRVKDWLEGKRIAPIHIDMGLTKFCNMGCIYCIGVTQGMQRGEMIKGDVLLRFIDDCGRLGVRSIGFIGDGEPTLNPALYDVVMKAKDLGIDIGIATNGLLLDMDRAHDMLRSLTFIRFNLSAAGHESFKKIHKCSISKFDMLIGKIKGLVKIKRENNYCCTIGIQMVLIPENFDQVMKLAALGAEMGVDYLQIKQCSDSEYKELGINHEDYKRVLGDLKKAEGFSREGYMIKAKWNKINILNETDIYRQGFRKYDICYGTPFLGQISGDGKVYPCGPFFGKERFYIDNIHEESYYDIVKGDRYWKVHQDIIDNVDVHYDCTVGCRQDYINKFLWDLKNPPEHINFV
ncbi:MAG: radical SAM protein [Candidatus Omnitrophica bacterium]|nr:radical SAM protein [Candidatus Omnitrophota bacterium]MBU4590168.1 radical SAM protein [Candidatus Omnitrophota bacterium]